MALQTTTSIDHAVEFLEWFFGTEPDGRIYVLRTQPVAAGDAKRRPISFSSADKMATTWWDQQAHKWNQTFATATIRDEKENNQSENCISIPALWFDIDGCKELNIPGEEFYKELRDTEDVSCWTRSSANGIQGFYKLVKPFRVDGDKDLFKDELQGLLWDICYYFGGDSKVLNLGRTMRLPGSLNVKPEYTEHYRAQAKIFEDNNYKLKDLKARFKPDPEAVPRLVAYACKRALMPIYEKGDRHEVVLYLCGSARKAGINKKACLNLVKEITKYFGDTDDRTSEVETTYDNNLDEIATLSHDYKEAHQAVTDAISFWVKLKVAYCKYHDFEFYPENVDPIAGEVSHSVGDFYIVNNQTWFSGKKDDQMFCNFSIELKGKIIKADSSLCSWQAVIRKGSDMPVTVEIPAEKLSSWIRFNSAVPVGLSCLQLALWPQYIAWLDTQCPDRTLMESACYGILDADRKEPTLLLPGRDHPKYVWAGGEDTAVRDIFNQSLDPEECKEYLALFGKYCPEYHEKRYTLTGMGWFAASMISSLIYNHHKMGGFPILMVCGLAGSGKSWLCRDVLALHFGAQRSHSYKSTTNYALRRKLVTNSVCPMVLDEFRISSTKFQADKRSLEIEDTIRNLFDHNQVSQGQANSAALIKGRLITPLALMGEHHYSDEATTQRTVTVRLNRRWLKEFNSKAPAERKRLERQMQWLQNSEHEGWLGTIILNWVETHMDEVSHLVDKAWAIADQSCPLRDRERKFKGFVSVITGHLLLARVWKAYGVKYPVSTEELLEALYAADPRMLDANSYDTATMQMLFEITDQLIINAQRQKATLENVLYVYDLEDKGCIYVDIGRWHRFICNEPGAQQIASLSDKTAFREVLADHAMGDKTPFIDFPQGYGMFHESCVKIDLRIVAREYAINVDHWAGIEEFNDNGF